MYHKVNLLPPKARHQGNYVLPEAFDAQLAALKSWGYESVTFDDWLGFRDGSADLPKRPLIITFDDGYRSTHDIAWPLLRSHGFSATVFLVSGLIGKTNTWDTDEIQEPLLPLDEILEMQKGGMIFGSHTRTHAALTKIPPALAKSELEDSRNELEAMLGRHVTTLCYPYAKQNQAVRDLTRRAGYRSAVIGKGGVNRASADAYALRRIKIDTRTTIPRLRWTLLRARFGL